MKCLAAGVAAVLALGTLVAGCGVGATTTVIERTAAAPVSAARAASPGRAATRVRGGPVTVTRTVATPAPPASTPQVFTGSGQLDLGTMHVPEDSVISWNCPSCGSTNFIINNAQSDANAIATNALGQTQGVDPIAAGDYHTVVVDTTGGPWTVAIGRTAPAPTGSAQAAQQSEAQSSSPSTSSATQCDSNVSVAGGTCPFAENTFYEYWAHGGASSFAVRSPAADATLEVSCSGGSQVSCTSSDATTVSFPQAAVARYTPAEASAYARSHNPGP